MLRYFCEYPWRNVLVGKFRLKFCYNAPGLYPLLMSGLLADKIKDRKRWTDSRLQVKVEEENVSSLFVSLCDTVRVVSGENAIHKAHISPVSSINKKWALSGSIAGD